MNTTALISVIIAILILSGLFFYFKSKGKIGTNIEKVEHGPFTIERKNIYGSRYDINTASRRDNSRSKYSIYYKGKLIVFPPELDSDTGVSGLWKVYILSGTNQPALLAGSKNIFLITEENNSFKLNPISNIGSGFISLQWLDTNDGQPGLKQELYSSNDTEKGFELNEGQYLLINKCNVLDTKELIVYPFKISSDYTDDYYANQVVAFSPDEQSVVYMGTKRDQSTRETMFALMVYNFKINQSNVIPFDRTETRLHEPYKLNSGWIDSFFKWKETTGGVMELEKRKLDQPPNWQGYFSDKAFSLSPVEEGMLEVFYTFSKEYLKLSDDKIRIDNYNSSTQYCYTIGENRLEISYFDESKTVYFSSHFANKNEEEAFDLLKNVADSFNEELSKGSHQDLFTSFENSRY